MRPEAQYAYELYRCLYAFTGGKCVIHSEYSYTVEGRIDFFIKSRQWGIECIKDSDRMLNHEKCFQGQGAYGSWGIVCDYIILNFCTKPPKKKRGMVFQPSSFGNNVAVVTNRSLFPDNSKLFHIGSIQWSPWCMWCLIPNFNRSLSRSCWDSPIAHHPIFIICSTSPWFDACIESSGLCPRSISVDRLMKGAKMVQRYREYFSSLSFCFAIADPLANHMYIHR